MATISYLDTTTFDETVGAADKPVLIDFTAAWCGPCKTVAPILDELAVEQADRLSIAKVDVDEQPDIAQRYDVMSMPTFILFKDGQPVHRLVGARGKRHLLEELDRHL
jgi:thioredoxin 1